MEVAAVVGVFLLHDHIVDRRPRAHDELRAAVGRVDADDRAVLVLRRLQLALVDARLRARRASKLVVGSLALRVRHRHAQLADGLARLMGVARRAALKHLEARVVDARARACRSGRFERRVAW